MKLTIEVPTSTFDAIQDLQHRILSYEVEPDQARAEMLDLIAPYTTYIPTENDETTIVRYRPLISIPQVRVKTAKKGANRRG